MNIQLFKPLETEGDTFQLNKIGDLSAVSSFSYYQRFYEPGEFVLVVPMDALFADKIKEDTLLLADRKYWLRVLDIHTEIDTMGAAHEIVGTDLKGLLLDRITLFGEAQDTGTQGYDVVQGPTETVLKHYIQNNLTQPSDSNRKIQGLIIAEDKGRGILQDTYMSRFEVVSDVAKKVCKNANVGYDITVSLETNCMVFDLIEPMDRTIHQSERNRVIFEIGRNNIAKVSYEHGVSSEKNVFYATRSGGTLEADALTQMVTRPENPAPKGIYRREMQMNVSTSSSPSGEEITDITELALKQAEDYMATSSFECPISNRDEFGSSYFLGDYVTTKSKELDIILDTQITQAHVFEDSQGKSLELTFGEKKPKPMTQLLRKIQNKGV